MKKRVRLAIAVLVLAMIVFITFWKFDLGKRLVEKLIEWEMPQVPYNVLIFIGAVVILAVIIIAWKLLDIIPKRQAATVAKTKALIKPTELFSIENEARKTLSQIIGGFVFIIGLLFTGANLAITQRQAERSRALDLEGQITDRFTEAIKQLDSKNAIELRLGGIYALERIAKDSERDHWTIMEVLTAYVREHASREKQGNIMKPSTGKSGRNTKQKENAKLPTDIQAILTVIGRRKIPEMGETDSLDLVDTILHRADLRNANLSKANLHGADLSRALLTRADLEEAYFDDADLSKAYFYWANLRKAILVAANLSGAHLDEANLRGADIRKADLSGADLSGANLSGANLSGANLSGAILSWTILSWANLSGANLSGANLSGADLSRADLRGALNLSWQSVSQSIVDDETKLPNEIESQHKDELRAMREQTKRARADRNLTEEQ